MLSYAEATQKLQETAALCLAENTTTDRTEEISLNNALGRISAQDHVMTIDQPPFDRATMDGYAIVRVEGQNTYTVRGVIHAGELWNKELQPGDAIRIMTGAPAPKLTTVIPIELTDGGVEKVIIQEPIPKDGANIAWQGEDAAKGDVVLAKGCTITPIILSMLAMAGHRTVLVYKTLQIDVLTTGDEVGGEGEAAIFDSNGPLLSALFQVSDAQVNRRHIRDAESDLVAAFVESTADIIISTGGVSAGTKDFIPAASTQAGFDCVFHKVQIKPGKPVYCARRGYQLFLGLPGNPVSVMATWHIFVQTVLLALRPGAPILWQRRCYSGETLRPAKRHTFQPAQLLDDGSVRVLKWNGSGDLLAAASADGFVSLEIGQEISTGAELQFLPFAGFAWGQHSPMPRRLAQSNHC